MRIFYIILFLIILGIVIWGGVTQWRFVKGKDKEGFEGKNLTIVILAGGPPKKNRQRFLEEKNGKTNSTTCYRCMYNTGNKIMYSY